MRMLKNYKIVKLITVILIIVVLSFSVRTETSQRSIETPVLNSQLDYLDEDYWEWHTRTTTNDKAYNGKHIKLTDVIHFYGYGQTSYKDFLYKDYDYAGEKIMAFQIDETKGNYHSLDGAGFIFNANQKDGKLTGYVLLIQETKVVVYRLEDVDIEKFETTAGRSLNKEMSVANYASEIIATVDKPMAKIHKLIVKVSPTNITMIDNDNKILDVNLDYSKHSGEDFGPLVSYVQHDCNILSEIEFSAFELKINDYIIPVTATDEKRKWIIRC